jgi:integrase
VLVPVDIDALDLRDAAAQQKVRRSFATLDEAREWRANALVGMRAGTVRAGRRPLLRDVADELIDGMRSGAVRARGGGEYRASVVRKYRTCLDAYVLPELGGYRLDQITHPMLIDHAELLLGRGLAPGTIRNAFDPLRVVLRRAVARGIIGANPATGLTLPGGDRTPRDRVASPSEANALVEALATARDRALWATALFAGVRRGELRALRWRHVDLPAGRINVTDSMDDQRNTTDPKSRAGTRRVPITPPLRKHLVALRAEGTGAPDHYVFGETPTAAFASTTIYRRARNDWQRTYECGCQTTAEEPPAVCPEHDAAPLAAIALHECRHSCISPWIAAGVNIKVASTMAGHATIAITLDRYGHLMPGAEDEALAKINAYTTRSGTAAG